MTEQTWRESSSLVKDNTELQHFLQRLLNQEAWLSLHSLHESRRSVRADSPQRFESLCPQPSLTVSQADADQYARESSLPHGPLSVEDGPARKQVVREWQRLLPTSLFNWIIAVDLRRDVLLGIGLGAIGTWIGFQRHFQVAPAIVLDDSTIGAQGRPIDEQSRRQL